jgi:chemotaxis signal transduction protein
MSPAIPGNPTESSAPAVHACWQIQGVWGTGRCVELRRFVHCRNCSVYSAAAARLLDRSLPENYRQNWTGHFSEKKEALQVGARSHLIFSVEGEWLALPTASLQEVAEPRRIRPVPHRRQDVLLGLVNVRGQLIPCISLHHALYPGAPAADPGARARMASQRLLIAGRSSERVAFPVDAVERIVRLDPAEIRPVSASGIGSICARGVVLEPRRSVAVLDEDALLGRLQECLG